MASQQHRGLRRAGSFAIAFVVALAGVVGLIAFFNSRDTSPVSTKTSGPGEVFPDQGNEHLRVGGSKPATFAYNSSPPTSGLHVVKPVTRDGAQLTTNQILTALEAGNVIFFYGSSQPPPRLRALADEVAGAFDPALVKTGQAVILARQPGTAGVVAAAWRHLLRAPSPTDPALQEFANAWLGVGAGGGK